PEREAVVAFAPYGMPPGLALIVPHADQRPYAAPADLAGMRVGLVAGSVNIPPFAEAGADVVTFPTNAELLAAIDSGAIPAAIVASGVAEYALFAGTLHTVHKVESF